MVWPTPFPYLRKDSTCIAQPESPRAARCPQMTFNIKEGLVEGEDAACLVCLHMAHEDIVERFRKSGSRDMDEYLLFMFETLRTHKQELLCLHRAEAVHLLLDELKEAFGGERAAKAKAHVSNTRLPTMWEASMQTS